MINNSKQLGLPNFLISHYTPLGDGGKKEWEILRSQIGMSSETQPTNNSSSQIVMSSYKFRGVSYLPFAFTEHGVTMLASILKSDKAVAMNIAIVRAFIALRQFAHNYKELAEQILELKHSVGNHNIQIEPDL
ncbi:MAG: hypothetical protein H0W12_10905 [Chitinophagaceae bacterium]|nr:hypothetical protein [Chitinophagaceae bacterium]